MSENLARNDFAWDVTAAPVEAPERGRERPLRAVSPGTRTRAQAKPKLLYAFMALGAIGAIVLTQILLSVGLSQGAYELNALQKEHRELGWQSQSIGTDLAAISSPQYIAANAQALGMTFGGTPAYLSLKTGEVTGTAAGTGPVKQVPANSIQNSMIQGAPIATAGGDVVINSGAANAPAGPANVSLDAGLPSPKTH
ncbi:hypothetical protein D9V34_06130 [Mycetocola lacteus]|uniref:Cell division protein FtsL n=1 Tax=Mycetocola lacteus TaxID=76637 RepID=A0A3L7ATY0_9MICO|nr:MULTISPECIES: hypothetical protein [Mycetocola]MCS4276944.1 hypothetical protein [Mycetocola sp. BIGb0189]RLP82832.1 hypothetical protein D9V34_06130 [Mycetocola lacteus]